MKRSWRALAVLGALIATTTAGAWKPSTHMYIAEEALRDAYTGGGYVSINILRNGQPQTPPVVRRYQVDPDLWAAIQANPGQYRAGVVGPDGFPDIATGQEVIHPGPVTVAADKPGIDANRWLEYLWNSSRTASGPVKAFTAGFLTHAAEDMFGHTLIDEYTETKFNIDPLSNAIKHLVVEGYIGRRTPNILKYDRSLGGSSTDVNDYVTRDDTSIEGVQDFMYHQMIDAQPGTILNNTFPDFPGKPGGGLYNGGGGEYSIPLIFSKLRASLQSDIDEYYTHKADLRRQIDDCDLFDFSCSATALTAELAWYMATNSVQITYKEHWRADIDEGLSRWPELSQNLSRDLLFPSHYDPAVPGSGVDLSLSAMDTDDAKAVAKSYVLHHLLSMMGAPDFVGYSVALVDNVTKSALDALQITYLEQLKDAAVDQLADYLVLHATGVSLDDWKAYFKNPERYFDPVMAQGDGQKITLADLNTKVLHLNDNQAVPDNGYAMPERRFDLNTFAPAYNSLTIAKMILLSPSEFHRLMADLGGAPAGAPLKDNAALGYINSLDNNNQWGREPSPFKTCAVFLQLFEPQVGGKQLENGRCDAGLRGVAAVPETSSNLSACGFLASQGRLMVSTSLYSCNRRYELRIQGDGNVVIYRDGSTPVWVTPNTWGHAVNRLEMIGDGHLALIGPANETVWDAPTWGHPGAILVLQNDGNLVVYDGYQAIWSTGPH